MQLAQNQRKKQENNTDLNKENENQNFAILKSVSIGNYILKILHYIPEFISIWQFRRHTIISSK